MKILILVMCLLCLGVYGYHQEEKLWKLQQQHNEATIKQFQIYELEITGLKHRLNVGEKIDKTLVELVDGIINYDCPDCKAKVVKPVQKRGWWL